MPQTSNSALTAYITSIQIFEFYAQAIIADNLKANTQSPRPSYLSMIDPKHYFGQKLITHLNRGAGEIESACSVASRYTPADLQALAGVSQVLLQGLNASRTLWSLYQILKPGAADPKNCPGAFESAKMLDELRDGGKIFTFFESEQAGLPSVQAASPKMLIPGQGTVVERVVRLFPNYGINSRAFGRGNQG